MLVLRINTGIKHFNNIIKIIHMAGCSWINYSCPIQVERCKIAIYISNTKGQRLITEFTGAVIIKFKERRIVYIFSVAYLFDGLITEQ